MGHLCLWNRLTLTFANIFLLLLFQVNLSFVILSAMKPERAFHTLVLDSEQCNAPHDRQFMNNANKWGVHTAAFLPQNDIATSSLLLEKVVENKFRFI